MTPWLETCRLCVADIRDVLERLPTRIEREPVLQRGEGGDDTTAIDQAAEDAVVERLVALRDDFVLVSEELGERVFGAGGATRVVVDPIDGSVNAKRGIPFFSFSLAVAEGPAMGDVTFGYVYDFGSGEEWTAERGGGAFLDGVRLGALRPKDTIEILSFEGTTTPIIVDRIGAMLDLAEPRARHGFARALALPPRGRSRGRRRLAEARAFRGHRCRAAARPRVRPRHRAVRGSAVRLRTARPRRPLARSQLRRSPELVERLARACATAGTLAAMRPDRDAILKALENVIDPELRRPVTELDMVRDVLVEDDGSVSVTIASRSRAARCATRSRSRSRASSARFRASRACGSASTS